MLDPSAVDKGTSLGSQVFENEAARCAEESAMMRSDGLLLDDYITIYGATYYPALFRRHALS
jgi:hypothetical protein